VEPTRLLGILLLVAVCFCFCLSPLAHNRTAFAVAIDSAEGTDKSSIMLFGSSTLQTARHSVQVRLAYFWHMHSWDAAISFMFCLVLLLALSLLLPLLLLLLSMSRLPVVRLLR